MKLVEKKTFPKMAIKKDKLILCFLAGILLLVVALPVKKESASVQQEIKGTVISDHAAALEGQLEQILSQIDAIGSVQVMITLEPLVDDREAPKICGVIVAAEAGDNPVQILKIQEAVMTLFQIDAHRIKVMKLK